VFRARKCVEQIGHWVSDYERGLTMNSDFELVLVLMGVAVMYLIDALQLRL
jgi:hypothetical protein